MEIFVGMLFEGEVVWLSSTFDPSSEDEDFSDFDSDEEECLNQLDVIVWCS